MSRTVLKAAASALLLSRLGWAAAADAGDLSILSFNVAGLPEFLQDNGESGDKETNSGLIGTYFGEYAFDLIHVQEDFNYHAYICKRPPRSRRDIPRAAPPSCETKRRPTPASPSHRSSEVSQLRE